MENTPMTLEEANERLGVVLKSGNKEEIEKWDFIIRSENEWRIKNKHKERAVEEAYLGRLLRRSYRL